MQKHDLQQPSEQERIEYEMTRLPFRSWCTRCIKGRTREKHCCTATEEERQVPDLQVENMFMGDEKEWKTLAFVVARERATNAVLSTVVPRKSTGDWICRTLMA